MGYKESQGITSRSIAYQDETMFGWRYACNYYRSDDRIASTARLVIRQRDIQATFGEYAALNYFNELQWDRYYKNMPSEKWRIYSLKLVIR